MKSFCEGPGGGFFKKSPLAAGGTVFFEVLPFLAPYLMRKFLIFSSFARSRGMKGCKNEQEEYPKECAKLLSLLPISHKTTPLCLFSFHSIIPTFPYHGF
jgi:hypothetical protein